MKAFLACLLAIVFLLGACAPAAPAALPTGTPKPADTPTVPAPVETLLPFSMVQIPAPSLEGNVLGDRAERNLYVYLPPSYNTSEKRYPVVYFLPGYTTTIMPGVQLPGDFDALIESGEIREMIVVVASGVNKLGGSMYVNSPMGDWEDFIVQDVVGYVDSHFRTLPQAASRGIGGHSMGGFGSLNIAMRHPEVFGAVYSLSPALYDETALERSLFANEFANRAFLKFQADLAELSPEKAASRLPSAPNQFTLAYGLAFAPLPDRSPYFEYPYKEVDGELVRDDAIWAKWQSGFGGIAEETVQYKDNLLQLKGIVVDYGTADEFTWIPDSCEYYGEQLTAAGIPVKVVSYNGDHNNQIGNRIREYLLPFFSDVLKFE